MLSQPKTILNAFTVDLEDWFQGLTSTNPLVDRWPEFADRVEPATQKVLHLLDMYQVKATFFVLGYVADQHPTLIETIFAAGHEIGIHGYYHRFVSQMTPGEFEDEIAKSVAAVMRITGKAPISHRAPYFSINAETGWAFDILQTHGIRYDSSVFPTRNMLYGFPDAPRFPYRVPGTEIIEFPASTVRLGGVNWPMAGGFYVRMLPYALIRAAVTRLNRRNQPAVIYLHPWELDLAQPAYPVTPRERLTHFGGRRGLEKKLHRLLADFSFTTLESLYRKHFSLSASQPISLGSAED